MALRIGSVLSPQFICFLCLNMRFKKNVLKVLLFKICLLKPENYYFLFPSFPQNTAS